MKSIKSQTIPLNILKKNFKKISCLSLISFGFFVISISVQAQQIEKSFPSCRNVFLLKAPQSSLQSKGQLSAQLYAQSQSSGYDFWRPDMSSNLGILELLKVLVQNHPLITSSSLRHSRNLWNLYKPVFEILNYLKSKKDWEKKENEGEKHNKEEDEIDIIPSHIYRVEKSFFDQEISYSQQNLLLVANFLTSKVNSNPALHELLSQNRLSSDSLALAEEPSFGAPSVLSPKPLSFVEDLYWLKNQKKEKFETITKSLLYLFPMIYTNEGFRKEGVSVDGLLSELQNIAIQADGKTFDRLYSIYLKKQWIEWIQKQLLNKPGLGRVSQQAQSLINDRAFIEMIRQALKPSFLNSQESQTEKEAMLARETMLAKEAAPAKEISIETEDENPIAATKLKSAIKRKLSLETVPPLAALVRGCFGGDCSMVSVPYHALLAEAQVFYIRSQKGEKINYNKNPDGYVFVVKVFSDGKSIPLVVSINGPRLTSRETKEIIHLIGYYYKTNVVGLPNIKKQSGLINWDPIREELVSLVEKSEKEKVNFTFPSAWDQMDQFLQEKALSTVENYYEKSNLSEGYLYHFLEEKNADSNGRSFFSSDDFAPALFQAQSPYFTMKKEELKKLSSFDRIVLGNSIFGNAANRKLISEKDSLEILKHLNISYQEVNRFAELIEEGPQSVEEMIFWENLGLNYKKMKFLGEALILKSTEKGRLEVVKHLLNRGIDINTKDKNGSPLLVFAAYSGNAKLVELLLSQENLDSTAFSKEISLLHSATQRGSVEVLKILLASEKFSPEMINSRNVWGQTLLDYASKSPFSDLALVILNIKNLWPQTINARNPKTGLSPLEQAALLNNAKVFHQFLKDERLDSQAINQIVKGDGVNPSILTLIIQAGSAKILSLILNDKRLDPAVLKEEDFKTFKSRMILMSYKMKRKWKSF